MTCSCSWRSGRARICLAALPDYELLELLLGQSLRRGDACLSIFSLPYLFNVSLRDAPDPVPYLRADATQSARWAQRLRDDRRLRVGLV